MEVGREERIRRVARIWDKGLGVPEAERGRIFEGFFGTTVAKPYDLVSLGAGKSAKEIVTRMGGGIALSRAPLVAASSNLSLPLQRGPVTSSN